MIRFALIVLTAFAITGCNTDGFDELPPKLGSGNVGTGTVTQPTNPTIPTVDTKPAFCKSLTQKTCQQIKNENYRSNSPTSLTDGCVEVQQQESCFGDKDRDAGGVKDGFLCEAQYGKNCRATTTN